MRSLVARVGGLLATLASILLIAAAAHAQRGDAVDCGNGFFCPAGNACLLGGFCGKLVEALPGETKTSVGTWCERGFHESKFNKGKCIPDSYLDCPGLICPPGSTGCGANGICEGGPPATGPMCGGVRCAEGRVCTRAGTCLNPQYFKECESGSICTHVNACQQPTGCAKVEAARTRQFQSRR